MRKKLVELQRIWYPEEYKTTYIYTYDSFNDELSEMMSNSGYVKEFKVKYHKSLRFLENIKKNCIMQPNVFESLKDAPGLYAMRLSGKKNIRILFSFERVEEREVAILYCCFQEKSTKDYQQAIILAQDRRKRQIESRDRRVL